MQSTPLKPTESLVCIVDDDSSMRDALQDLVQTEGWRAETFSSPAEFLQRPRSTSPDCLILDVDLPGMSGLDLQNELARGSAPVPIIFLTGRGDIPMSVRAIKAGALEFLTKPFDPGDLIETIRHALALSADDRQPGRRVLATELIGTSTALRTVLRQIGLVAETNATVLITGESGTGKELVARAIHERGARRNRPMIKVNCGAIPDTLFESELFGHMRGAFTGAVRDKPGRFELADGGTIFLDEIGELPLAMQVKLLRVIQEKEIERVGDLRSRKIDVRIIAATNRELGAEVATGRFRQDLFYRLSVFPIESPPLRDRREDIPLLADHFIQLAARRLKCRAPRLTPPVANQLSAHDWPGNIRELQNAVERAVILARGGPLQFDSLIPPPRRASDGFASESSGTVLVTRSEMKQRERDGIAAALAQTGGKVSGPDGAAALLGMKPTTLYSRISALGLPRSGDISVVASAAPGPNRPAA